MSGILYGGQLNTKLSIGGMIINDYRIIMEEIEGGHRLVVTRGSEVQTMDIMDGKDGDGGNDIIIDVTLLNSGEAADAKVVGDKLRQIMDELGNKVDAEEGKGLSSNDFTDELLEKLNALSEEPVTGGGEISSITVAGAALDINNGTVNIPIAKLDSWGVVKSSAAENGVTVNSDGTMTINPISFDMIVQTEEDEVVIMTGGSASF